MTEQSIRPRRWSTLFAFVAGLVMVVSAMTVIGGASAHAPRTAEAARIAVSPATGLPPAWAAWATLDSVWDTRADLQAAYPDAFSSITSFTGLLNWAGGVVTHEFPDNNYTTLAPCGYLYTLMLVYDQRPDLQSKFPGVVAGLVDQTSNPEYAQLVNWAGGVETGKWADSASAPLDLYGYYYALMMVYDGRTDLQTKFPDALAGETDYDELVDWAGEVVTGAWNDTANATLGPAGGYYYDLMMVYDGRFDLQTAFPNAYFNDTSYEALLGWADDVVAGAFTDADNATLSIFATSFMALAPWRTTPIGTAFAAGDPIANTCAVSSTFSVNGCKAGDYIYEITIETSSQVAFDNVLLEVKTSTGAIESHVGAGGFSIMSIGGQVLAQTPIPGGESMAMVSTFTTYGIGVWPETYLTSVYSILLDMGTANPAGLGYTFVVVGTNGYAGTTGSLSLP